MFAQRGDESSLLGFKDIQVFMTCHVIPNEWSLLVRLDLELKIKPLLLYSPAAAAAPTPLC